jgi:hypothetical protein
MRQSKSRNQKKRDSKGAVVSHSSILIISAFLIGSAAGKAPNPTMQMYLFMLGVFGFVSYFGLGHVANRRQAGAVSRKQQRAAKKLELRVDRHVARSTSTDESPIDEQTADADCQLVPAVGIQ